MKNLLLLILIGIPCLNSFSQNIITNGTMETGAIGFGQVPTGYSLVTGTPDHCQSGNAFCSGTVYVISNPSPQGGKWTRFFRSSGNDERFGQTLTTPLVTGVQYTLTFYAAHSKLNTSATPANTGIQVGFRNGVGTGTAHSSTVSLTNPEVWKLHTYTFIAAAGYNFISFTKTTAGSNSAVYVDDLKLVRACNVTANAGPNRSLTCSNPNDPLTGSQTGGSGSISYSWSPPTGLNNANISNPTSSANSTTNYILTVTDGNGCTDTDVVNVSVNKTPPNANAGPNRTTTCTTPSANLAGSGGGTYSWNNGAGTSATPTVNPGSTTNYTLIVTGANGCTDTDVTTVTVNKAPPTANAGPNRTTTCTTPTANLAGSGGGTYSWNNGAGTSATPNVNPGSTTNYTLIVTGANGCTDTDVTTVTVNKAAPTANAGPNRTTTCITPTANLVGSGGGSYSWNNGAGTSASPTVNPVSTTNYMLTVTGANGCTDTDIAVVTVDETPPNANAGPNRVTNCITPTASLSGSGGGTYSWNNGAGTSANPTVNPITNTNYTVTVTGTNGCTDTDVTTVTVDKSIPNANAGLDITVDCATPTANLTGTGGGTYSWSNGGNTATTSVTPTNTTNYILTVTGSNGCTDTDATTVTVNGAVPVANAGPDFTTNCITPTATLTGSGGGTYSWNNGAGTSSNPTVNPATTTTYTLVVTATNGCTDTDAVIITVDETLPTANAGANITLDCATTSGSFTGSGGGTYAWTSPNGASSVAGFSVSDSDTPGNYILTVTAANGCTDTDVTILAIDQAIPVANAGMDQTSSCAVPSVTLDGSASSGTGITYAWTGPNVTAGNSTNMATADLGGTYTLTVTGSNFCTHTDQVDVLPDLNLPIANAGPDQVLDCNNTSVSLDGSGSDNGTTITYSWTTAGGNITGNTATSISSSNLDGTYTITVINSANGCTATDNMLVTQDTVTPVNIVTNSNYVIDCNNPTATFDASGTTGTGNTFTWSTSNGNIVSGGTTDSPTVDLDGTYSLTVTSANGCQNLNTTNVLVTIDTISPTIQINVADTLTCNIPQVVLDASGSQTGATYSWTTINGFISSGALTSTPTVDNIGDYNLTITLPNGCSSSQNTTVVNSEVPVAHIVTNTTQGEVDLTVLFSDTSSGLGLTHYWDFGTDNLDDDTLSPTTFTYTDVQEYEVVLTVTDQYGCISTDTVIISALELSAIEVPNIFTPNGDGNNDLFHVRGGGIKNMNARIMSRWGQLIYEWDSPNGGWDGYSIAGIEAAPGTYFYFINVEFNDGHNEEFTGSCMLKR